MTLLDELKPVIIAHGATAVVFGVVYGETAAGVVLLAGTVWCGIVGLVDPVRRLARWTSRR